MHRSYGLQGSLKRLPPPYFNQWVAHGKKWSWHKCLQVPTFAFTHTRLRSKDRTQRLTRRNRGRFGWGRYYYPRSISHVSETLRGQVSERQTLPLLGLGRGRSRRTQKAFGTAMRMMRVAVPRRRGPAGLRDLFTFVEVAACTPCAQGLSACAKEGWYHYPRCAPRAAETPDGRLSKRLICRLPGLVTSSLISAA